MNHGWSEIRKIIKSLYEDKLNSILTEQDFIDLSGDYNRERDNCFQKQSNLLKKQLASLQKETDQAGLIKLVQEFAEFAQVTKPILVKLIDRVEVAEDKKVTIYYRFKKPF